MAMTTRMTALDTLEAKLLAASLKLSSHLLQGDEANASTAFFMVTTILRELPQKAYFELHMKLLIAADIETPESAQRRIDNYDASEVRQGLHAIMGAEGCAHCHCGEGEKCCYCDAIIPPLS